MNINVEDAGTCLKKISVEIPADMVKKKLNDGYRDVSRQVNLPGFRPGKAPRAVLEKKFSKHVIDEVRQRLLSDAVDEAARKHNMDLIGQPEVGDMPEVKDGQPLNFNVMVEVRPEFELSQYKGIELESAKAVIDDREVEIFLKNVQYSRGKMEELGSEKSKAGDVLLGNFEVIIDGETIANRVGGTIEIGGGLILGVSIPEAEKAFTGLAGKEPVEKRFKATLPADFPIARVRGKEAEILVQIKEIRRPNVPPLNDDLAKELGFDTVDALKEHGREVLQTEKQHQIDRDIEERVLAKLIDETKIDIPSKLAERQLAVILRREAFQKFQEGMEENDIAKFIERRKDELPAVIERQIRLSFIIDAIARKERIFVTEEQVAHQIAMLAASRNADPQRLLYELEKSDMMGQVRWDIKANQVRTLLRQKAKITVPGGAEAAKSE